MKNLTKHLLLLVIIFSVLLSSFFAEKAGAEACIQVKAGTWKCPLPSQYMLYGIEASCNLECVTAPPTPVSYTHLTLPTTPYV